jgi:hypothetical protein
MMIVMAATAAMTQLTMGLTNSLSLHRLSHGRPPHKYHGPLPCCVPPDAVAHSALTLPHYIALAAAAAGGGGRWQWTFFFFSSQTHSEIGEARGAR